QPHDIAFAGYAVARERRLAEKAAADLLRAEPQRRGAIAPARRKIPPGKVVAIKRLRGVATRTVGAAIVAEQYLIARRNLAHAAADALDNARAFMPEHDRQRNW